MADIDDDDAPELSDVAVAAFVADLREITLKHKIIIHGCGCCGSPSLERLESEGGAYAVDGTDYLTWKEHQ